MTLTIEDRADPILRHFDAFSGFGGFALAAKWTGAIETVAFCEIEPYCCRVLNKNFPNVPILGDITKLGNAELDPFKAIDIFTGGFPCQPYSIAGKRRGDSDDRALWREMLRVIEILQPRWIVGENVAGILSMVQYDREPPMDDSDNAIGEVGDTFNRVGRGIAEEIMASIEAQGYEVEPFVVPAAGVGAWHERKRVIIVAHTNGIRLEKHRMCDANLSERPGATRTSNELEQTCKYVPDSNGSRQLQSQGSVEEQRGWVGDICENAPDANSQSLGRTAIAWRERDNWGVEPNVGRVAHGISYRVERITGLGNAVVPQQVYPILQAIVDIERNDGC